MTDREKSVAINTFRKWLNSIDKLSSKTWELLLESINIRELDKNNNILKTGEDVEHFRFISSGVVKSECYINGSSFVNTFYTDLSPIYTVMSFTEEEMVNNISLTTVTPTVLVEIKRTDLINMLSKDYYFKFQNLSISLTNIYLFKTMDEICRLRVLKAKDRYIYLMKHYPSVIMYAKLEDIASYLNIIPSSLSRIRAKIVSAI